MNASPPEDELHHAIEQAVAQWQGLTVDAAAKPLADEMIALLRAAGATNRHVFERLLGLMNFIASARKEIAAIRPGAIGGQHIPIATDELDAVAESIGEATHKIMDCGDAIALIAAQQPEPTRKALTREVTRIFESCNFHDITGQRITKVVRTLKHIESQVAALLSVLQAAGLRTAESEVMPALAPDGADGHLLHGPQKGDRAIKQDDIDKLFS
ncbi:MAG TPA: protein phosphatase CheZ [Alphaproteobacteria bacterium]|nr:protein phosphatase CheZ [Alphaproteobacteria bacterium]